MLGQKTPSKPIAANTGRVISIKRMKSAQNLLSPTTTVEEADATDRQSEKQSSQKSTHSITKSRVLKRITRLDTYSSQLFKAEDLRDELIKQMQRYANQIIPIATSAQKAHIERKISEINDLKQWRICLQCYFECQSSYRQILLRQERNVYRYTPRSSEKRAIMISGDKSHRKSKAKRSQKIQQERDLLKRELANAKTKITDLEKNMLKIVQEYKVRKEMYLKEIDKLTKIVTTSIKDLPALFTPPTLPTQHQRKNSQIAITITPEQKATMSKESLQQNDRMHLYFSNVSAISKVPNPEDRKQFIAKLPEFDSLAL